MISTPATAFRKTITKGNQRRPIRCVPKSCRDSAPDSGRSDRLHYQAARLSSSKTSRQPRLLRRGYQPTAASASSSAAGWIRRESPLTAPVGREGAFVRRPRRSIPRFHRQSASAEARSLSSTLLSHLRRRSRPGSQSGNRSARNLILEQCEGVAKQFRRMALRESILPRRLWARQR